MSNGRQDVTAIVPRGGDGGPDRLYDAALSPRVVIEIQISCSRRISYAQAAIALLLLLLLACGGAPGTAEKGPPPRQAPSTVRAPVACGKATCDGDHYCQVKCTCCGAYLPAPGQATAAWTCQPLPASCRAVPRGGDCPATVQLPCA
jgi:hypothetical protein